MNKKWLYSSALSVLLIAGEALGITVHDVLSNGFWSTQERATEMSLNAETTDNYKEKYKKETETPREDGSVEKSYLYTKKGKTTNDVVWAQSKNYWGKTGTANPLENNQQTLKVVSRHRKEQSTSDEWKAQTLMETCPTNIAEESVASYSFKPCGKGERPVAPFFMNTEWLARLTRQFYPSHCWPETLKTETNIVSDMEAQITGRLSRSSVLPAINPPPEQMPINPGSGYGAWGDARYAFTKKITIEGNQVIIALDVNEFSSFTHKVQGGIKTKYVATFGKNGQWKKSTEVVSQWRSGHANDWYTNYYRIKQQETE